MSKESITTYNRQDGLRIIRSVMGNIHALDSNDMKVLEFLGKKGFFEKQKAKLVPNKR